MKRRPALLLQVVVVLFGLGTLAFMLWEPHLEGRNAHATTFEIFFKDPFLAYMYVGSTPFFVALYRAFRLSGHVRQSGAFSQGSVDDLRVIRRCALAPAMTPALTAVDSLAPPGSLTPPGPRSKTGPTPPGFCGAAPQTVPGLPQTPRPRRRLSDRKSKLPHKSRGLPAYGSCHHRLQGNPPRRSKHRRDPYFRWLRLHPC